MLERLAVHRLLAAASALVVLAVLPPAAATAQNGLTCAGETTVTVPGQGGDARGAAYCTGATAVRVTRQPQHGHLDTARPGSLIDGRYGDYAPALNYTGPDSFEIVASNDAGDSDPIRVDVVVNPSPVLCGPPSLQYLRVGVTTTTLVYCLTPVTFDAPPLVAGNQVASPVSVAATTPIESQGTTIYAYRMTFGVAADFDVNRTLTSAVRATAGPVTQALPLNLTTQRTDGNHWPTCIGPLDAGYRDRIGVGMSVVFAVCTDPDGDPLTFVPKTGTFAFVSGGAGAIFTAPSEATDAYEAELQAVEHPPEGVFPDASATSVRQTFVVQAPRCTTTALATPRDTPVTQTFTCPGVDDLIALNFGASPSGSAAEHGSVQIAHASTPGTFRVTYAPDAGYTGRDGFALVTRVPITGDERMAVTVDVGGPPAADPDPVPGPAPQVPAPAPPTGPGAPAAVSERERVLALIRGTGLKAVMKAVRTALAKNRAKAPIRALPYAADVAVTLTAKVGKRRAVKQGGARLKLRPNRRGTLKLSLTKAAKRTLKRKRRLRVTVVLTLTNPGTGARATLKQGVTIKASKSRPRHAGRAARASTTVGRTPS